MVSDKVAEQMTAVEARKIKLQESQCQLGDAINMLVNSDTLTLGGGVPPMIDTNQ